MNMPISSQKLFYTQHQHLNYRLIMLMGVYCVKADIYELKSPRATHLQVVWQLSTA